MDKQVDLYDQALDILDKLLDAEDDYHRASLINSIMMDLIKLKHHNIICNIDFCCCS